MIFKKWPSRNQWGLYFKVLDKKEKIIFLSFFLVFIVSFLSIFVNFYNENTIKVARKGGVYREGVIGQPRFINPIYLQSDIDKDLAEIVFSGLLKFGDDLDLMLDLAESYQIEEDGRVYRFFLREDIYWSDGESITADDVIFTIRRVQNMDYRSHFRLNWLGVEIEKISPREIKFELKRPYSSFLENLTLKIMPMHIWKDVSAQNFFSDKHQLMPIGSGPYNIEKIEENEEKIESITLLKNPYYHGKKPFMSEIEFLFFENEEKLLRESRRLDGFHSSSERNNFNSHQFRFPRYFAVFLNLESSSLLKDLEIRKALNYSIDRSSFPEEEVISPVLPEIYGIDKPERIEFNPQRGEEILDSLGFNLSEDGFRYKTIERKNSFQFKEDLKLGSRNKEVEELQRCLSKLEDVYPEEEITGYFGNKTKDAVIMFQEKFREEILEPWNFTKGTGMVSKTTREKLNELCFSDAEEIIPLELELKTIEQNILIEIGEELKKKWEEIGIKVNLEIVSREERDTDLIKPRNYEMLLLGKVLGAIPDFFPFWHSSQKEDPGYNFSLYENKEVDSLLEEIRISSLEDRDKLIFELQNIILEDMPALFLYSPNYLYLSRAEGISTMKIADPSKRFSNIENWFLRTKRVWK